MTWVAVVVGADMWGVDVGFENSPAASNVSAHAGWVMPDCGDVMVSVVMMMRIVLRLVSLVYWSALMPVQAGTLGVNIRGQTNTCCGSSGFLKVIAVNHCQRWYRQLAHAARRTWVRSQG